MPSQYSNVRQESNSQPLITDNNHIEPLAQDSPYFRFDIERRLNSRKKRNFTRRQSSEEKWLKSIKWLSGFDSYNSEIANSFHIEVMDANSRLFILFYLGIGADLETLKTDQIKKTTNLKKIFWLIKAQSYIEIRSLPAVYCCKICSDRMSCLRR